jgi:hypothetical protein
VNELLNDGVDTPLLPQSVGYKKFTSSFRMKRKRWAFTMAKMKMLLLMNTLLLQYGNLLNGVLAEEGRKLESKSSQNQIGRDSNLGNTIPWNDNDSDNIKHPSSQTKHTKSTKDDILNLSPNDQDSSVDTATATSTSNDNDKKEDSHDDNPHHRRRYAIVTLVTSSEYVAGAQVLIESLRTVDDGSMLQYVDDTIVLWVPFSVDERSDVSTEHMNLLLASGWTRIIALNETNFVNCPMTKDDIHQLNSSSQTSGMIRYWGTCGKFATWTLTEYDVVVYMDADSMVLHEFNFVWDIFLDGLHRNDGNEKSNTPYWVAAQGNTDCWETPPYNQCPNFYTALLIIRPSTAIATYLQTLAKQEGLSLTQGELMLLNHVITRWYHLPRYTLVAQSELARPITTDGDTDWTPVKVYDFAGPPSTKPWRTYWLQKSTGDKYRHEYLGSISPNSPLVARSMYPQWIWNDHYDNVLARVGNKPWKSRDEL